MKIDTLSVDFSDEQKRYLEGFTTGLQISRVGRGLGGSAGKANAEPTGPDAVHIKAQDKVIAAGKKLADQEKFKRCLLYTSPSPRDGLLSRMPSSA